MGARHLRYFDANTEDRPMQIIAVTNIKGGVGKTTACVNLAFLAAASGLRTLVWDLDPQGAATYLLHDAAPAHVSAKKLVSGKRELLDIALRTEFDRLDLLPADLSYRKFDVHLNKLEAPVERLLRLSRPLANEYDLLFMDCPAGISLLSENVLRAADLVLVPLLPTPLSLRTLAQLRDFLHGTGWVDMQLLPFFSMVDRRRSLHCELTDATRAQFPDILATEVPYSSEIERMTTRRAPIAAYAPRSAGAQIFSSLWRELVVRRPALAPRATPPKTDITNGATAPGC
jgi:cellulose biosynthesis protein BcsQ